MTPAQRDLIANLIEFYRQYPHSDGITERANALQAALDKIDIFEGRSSPAEIAERPIPAPVKRKVGRPKRRIIEDI